MLEALNGRETELHKETSYQTPWCRVLPEKLTGPQLVKKMLIGESKGRRRLRGPRGRWEDDIKMDRQSNRIRVGLVSSDPG